MGDGSGLVYAPVFVLECLTAAFSAVLFGLIAGRPVRRLVYMLPAAMLGVVLGQYMGERIQAPGLPVGDLHLAEATLGAWAMLLIARRLGV